MAKKMEKRLKTFDAYVSMALGLAIILILGALIFNYTSKKRQETAQPATGATGAQGIKPGEPGAGLPTTYVVKEGDNLWKIAEAFYKSGYNWVDIAKANNLANPGDIFSGNKLTIPDVAPKQITTGDITAAQTATPAPTIKEYTVKPGDSLWKIAVSTYGSGYKWVDIARANSLTNPDIIHSGNVLRLP